MARTTLTDLLAHAAPAPGGKSSGVSVVRENLTTGPVVEMMPTTEPTASMTATVARTSSERSMTEKVTEVTPTMTEKVTVTPGRSPQPDRESLAAAARLILNAVSETVLAQTAPAPSAPSVDPAAAVVSLPELLRTFLSDDERAILKALANAPVDRVTASWVQQQTGITKNDFWVVWAQLQVRGLIVQTGAGRSSDYALGPEWLRAIVLA